MLRLFDLVNRGWPLPLGGIDNRRSLVYVGNVAAAMADMLGKTRIAETFFVSDDEAVSTPELVVRIAAALGRKARLVRAPITLFGLTRWLGGSRIAPALQRLTESLTVDSSALLERRGAPLPHTLDEGLAATAEWFRSAR
jgi:nucleoside-diphosphate-sugar epimerase